MPGCRVEAITLDGSDLLRVDARGTPSGGRCPDCGCPSRAVHSRYRRQPADLPSLGRRVRVGLRVRWFYCRNARCGRRTFAEHLPELVAPHARRTCRLGEVQGRAGAALGGEAGSRLLRHLAMPASADTALRLVRRLPLPEAGAPRVVAVDDRALRKGRTYGTIVVDLQRRRVVDLLPDRSSTTVADWLRQRPGIEEDQAGASRPVWRRPFIVISSKVNWSWSSRGSARPFLVFSSTIPAAGSSRPSCAPLSITSGGRPQSGPPPHDPSDARFSCQTRPYLSRDRSAPSGPRPLRPSSNRDIRPAARSPHRGEQNPHRRT